MLVATHDVDELQAFTFDEHWHMANGRLTIDVTDAVPSTDRHETPPFEPTRHRGVGLLGLGRRSPGGV
jgi:hypothetical protein